MVSGDVCSGIHKDTAKTSPENLVGKRHTEVRHLDGSKKTGGGKLQPKKSWHSSKSSGSNDVSRLLGHRSSTTEHDVQ
jgi:hypothetical protein